MISETKIIFMTLFTNFSKTTAPQQVIFSGKLSTVDRPDLEKCFSNEIACSFAQNTGVIFSLV